jgi:GntR family transcriptional regulator, transcriptional repressor for pyruvate dehydrogenase complex
LPSDNPGIAEMDWSAVMRLADVEGRTGDGRRRPEVVRMIRDLIGELDLKPGDRLPGERQLAVRFGVSRGSVREGLQFLSIMGLIEVHHGGGSYLTSAPAMFSKARSLRRQWVIEHRGKVLETLEARLGTEVFAARLAAQRAGPEDLERLLSAMQTMRAVLAQPSPDVAAFVDCDLAFHDALLRAAGNRILRDLINALGEELLPERGAVTDLEGRVEETYNEHLAIFEAVRAADPDAAAEAMRLHIMSVRQDVLLRLLDEPQAPPAPVTESADQGPRGQRG